MANDLERRAPTIRESVETGPSQVRSGLHSEIGAIDEVASLKAGDRMVLPVLKERLSVTKRKVAAGTVRVETRTGHREEEIDTVIERCRAEVTRVPIGRVVDVAPATRTEGDVTIVPVVEERLVLVKQLFLTEELHVRRVVERQTVHETVTLRSQTVTIERRDASGRLKSRDDA